MGAKIDNLAELYKSVLYDSEKEYITKSPILSKDGCPFFRRGNISAITGTAGSKKSFLCSAIASVVITEVTEMGIEYTDKENSSTKCLYIDTEQSIEDAIEIAHRIEAIANINEIPEKEVSRFFNLAAVREFTPSQRVDAIEYYLKMYKPALLIIDGVTDLVENVNDMSESATMVCKILNWSNKYNCHICSVIHRNEGSESTKMRGHIGSEYMRKAEIILSLEANKDTNVTEVKITKSRKKKPQNFSFDIQTIPHKGKLVAVASMVNQVLAKEENKSDELKRIFLKAMKPSKGYNSSFLAETIARNENMSMMNAKRRIWDAKEKGIITQAKAREPYFIADINED